MSVIHYGPDKLGLIASALIDRWNSQYDILDALATLSDSNARAYDNRYPNEPESAYRWSIAEIKRYLKLSLTKAELVDAMELLTQLQYNCSEGDLETFNYLYKTALRTVTARLKTSWGIE